MNGICSFRITGLFARARPLSECCQDKAFYFFRNLRRIGFLAGGHYRWVYFVVDDCLTALPSADICRFQAVQSPEGYRPRPRQLWGDLLTVAHVRDNTAATLGHPWTSLFHIETGEHQSLGDDFRNRIPSYLRQQYVCWPLFMRPLGKN
jgi:hypothetical protein